MNFELLVATNNQHKLKEIRQILSPHKITVYGISDLPIKKIEEVEENGKDYFENALIKARALQKVVSMPIIADDTGLEILSMNNKPGIHTARFAQMCGGYDKAYEEINKQIKGKDRSAKFICCIVLLNVADKPLKFEGVVEGTILENPQVENGFGYDPIFLPNESEIPYSLLTPQEKNEMSHRGKALKKLLTYLRLSGLAK